MLHGTFFVVTKALRGTITVRNTRSIDRVVNAPQDHSFCRCSWQLNPHSYQQFAVTSVTSFPSSTEVFRMAMSLVIIQTPHSMVLFLCEQRLVASSRSTRVERLYF
jgi:hypothetical protein